MTQKRNGFRRWRDEFVRELEPLETALGEAWWRLNTRGDPKDEREVTRLEEAYRGFLASPERYDALRNCLNDTDVEPVEARERKILLDTCTRHQTDDATIRQVVKLLVEIESEYNGYRANLGGERVSDNHIKEVLRNSRDSNTVRAAWKASKQIGPRVGDRVLELVRLRNHTARALGYDNFQRMSLELNEQPPGRLFSLLEELAERTEEPFRLVKQELDRELSAKFGIPTGDLRPWHYGDPFFQSSPKTGNVDLDRFFEGKDLERLTARFFRGIGLQIEDLLARSDLYERDGKCQHAFCTHIDRQGDVRVLCNVRADEYWMSTMLHEFGHAAYDKYLDPDLPYALREPAHISTTEAIAMLFGRATRQELFLTGVAGAEPVAASRVSSRAQEELRRQQLVFVRWALVVVFFERELYANPDQDLNTLWWDLVETYQLLDRPKGRNAPDWAAKIHIATAPIYYQNYVLGELMASQLEDHLLELCAAGSPSWIDRPEVGTFLRRELFAPGKRYPWEELVERATGRPLTPDAFLRDFGAPSAG